MDSLNVLFESPHGDKTAAMLRRNMFYDFSDKNNRYANVNYNQVLVDRHIILLAHRSHIAKFYLNNENSEALLNGIILRLIELRKNKPK